MLYAQLIAFPFLVFASWRLGRRVSPSRRWWLVIAVGFLIFAAVIVGHRVPRLSVIPPFSWAVDSAVNPFLMTVAITAVFATLLPKLPPHRSRPGAVVGMTIMLVYYGLLPATLTLAARPALARLHTSMDRNQICRQTTGYTCGPAAAVTCLARLGQHAEEGDLARAAQCSPSFGTDACVLAQTLNTLYPALHCAYDFYPSLDRIPLPAIADCQIPGIGGHYVALLEVKGDSVIVGDPISGRQNLSRAQFLREWKGTAIAFEAPKELASGIAESPHL